MFYLMFISILTLLGNLLADLLYAAADPRVRLA
jgi:peptide/nickel transport system permease protein